MAGEELEGRSLDIVDRVGVEEVVAFGFAMDFVNHVIRLLFLVALLSFSRCAQLSRWEFQLASPPKLSLTSTLQMSQARILSASKSD
jgi:hypothetical protein